jgi:hypothetical protein
MPEITLPAPYSIVAKVGRSGKFDRHQISNEIKTTIPDVDPYLAPTVISVDLPWPIEGLEGQRRRPGCTDDQHRRYLLARNPTVRLRQHEGKFYAPVLIFEKDNAEAKPDAATPNDFKDIGDHRKVWATAFDRPFEHQTLRTAHQEPGTALHMNHRDGSLMWPDDKRIKMLQSGQEERQQSAIDQAFEEASRYIAIDGELWRSLRGEPVIEYEISRDRAVLGVVDTYFAVTTPGWGVFRLDRYQDCLDHINDVFGSGDFKPVPIEEYFSDLQIGPECELQFRDDAEMVLRYGHDTTLRLQRYMNGVGLQQTTDEMKAVHRRLFDLLGPGKEDRVDEIAAALEASRAVWRSNSFEAPGIELALRRWELRPMAAEGPMV